MSDFLKKKKHEVFAALIVSLATAVRVSFQVVQPAHHLYTHPNTTYYSEAEAGNEGYISQQWIACVHGPTC